MYEGLSVAPMASAYFKAVTGMKPIVVTLARFTTERDRIAEQFGGKLVANYLLGRVRDIEAEDREEADRLQGIMRECRIGNLSLSLSNELLVKYETMQTRL